MYVCMRHQCHGRGGCFPDGPFFVSGSESLARVTPALFLAVIIVRAVYISPHMCESDTGWFYKLPRCAEQLSRRTFFLSVRYRDAPSRETLTPSS